MIGVYLVWKGAMNIGRGGGGAGGWRLKVETGYQWSFLGNYLPTHPSPRLGLQDLDSWMDEGGGGGSMG